MPAYLAGCDGAVWGSQGLATLGASGVLVALGPGAVRPRGETPGEAGSPPKGSGA